MNKFEIIPDIETRIEADLPVLQRLLFDNADDESAFIDTDVEKNHQYVQYAEVLAQVLCDEPNGEQVVVAYRAIQFMTLIASLELCHEDIAMARFSYAAAEYKGSDLREYVEEVAQSYSEAHPITSGVVDAYMDEIDPAGKEGYLAEIVAGFIGTQIEDGLHEAALRKVAGALGEIASWDGYLPEDLTGAGIDSNELRSE